MQSEKKILRIKDLHNETGLAPRTIWSRVSEGTFPRPIPLGTRNVGWLAEEIEAWREARRKERDEAVAATKPRRPRGRPRKDQLQAAE